MTNKPKREGPLRVPLPFDEAIGRSLRVKPPPGGWKEYERARARTNRRDREPVPVDKAGDDEGESED